MKKIIVLLFALTISSIYSQSKKEQIQSLNFKIDSLNTIINSNNIRFNDEVNNLKKENLQLTNSISSEKITFEEKINGVNDSLSLLKNINKDLKDKISKQLDIIELFNNAHSIENRGFDPYKDSKLFSQILFLRILYHFDKIDGYFGSTYYGVVLGNRLVNANPKEVEKKIFEDEVHKQLTTNGSRTVRWFEENTLDVDDVVLSCHQKDVDIDNFVAVADYLFERGTDVSALMLMSANVWDRCIFLIENYEVF